MARILVLDDEPLIAMMLADWLLEQGQEPVGPAHTEEQAMALVGAGSIDAAILDVSLAGHDSFVVAAMLQGRSIPFAFATGHGKDAVAEPFRNLPTIMKPFNFETVGRVLDVLLQDRRSGALSD